MLANVPVGKPKKPQFFRTHASEDMIFPAMLLEMKEARETYVVMQAVAQGLSELVRPVLLHAAIGRQNRTAQVDRPLKGQRESSLNHTLGSSASIAARRKRAE